MIRNTNADSKQPGLRLLEAYLDAAFQRLLRTDNQPRHHARNLAKRLDSSGGRKRKPATHRLRCQFLESESRQVHLTLGGLLPRFVSAAVDLNRGGGNEYGVRIGREIGHGLGQVAGDPLDEAQAADLYGERRRRCAQRKAVRVHVDGLFRHLHFAIRARIDHAEIPPLTVLHRGRAVRVEKVALIEHGIGNFFNQRKAHDGTSSPTGRILSSAASQVGIPCRVLYS